MKHKTLADTFAYPINETGMVYMRMADSIRKNGGGDSLQQRGNQISA